MEACIQEALAVLGLRENTEKRRTDTHSVDLSGEREELQNDLEAEENYSKRKRTVTGAAEPGPGELDEREPAAVFQKKVKAILLKMMNKDVVMERSIAVLGKKVSQLEAELARRKVANQHLSHRSREAEKVAEQVRRELSKTSEEVKRVHVLQAQVTGLN